MNSIKLPVVVTRSFGACYVVDADGQAFTIAMSGQDARQIATALNSHDKLMAELRRLADCIGPADAVILNELLAKIESESVNEKPNNQKQNK